MASLIGEERAILHQSLLATKILTCDKNGVVSVADGSNSTSKLLAKGMYDRITANASAAYTHTSSKSVGQTNGKKFEVVIKDFISSTFPKLQNLRPGDWECMQLGNRNKVHVSDFAQYEHLNYLNALVKANKDLATMIGNDYLVAPDVVIYRKLYSDDELNTPVAIVDDEVAHKASLRAINNGKPILHASVSAKWTIRSDRAQNSRTEALNLIRNRKGSLPHIVVVTGEPLPSRLASLALGTGDIDCMYHVALYELRDTIVAEAQKDPKKLVYLETLDTLIDGDRLKDISDLPLDLSV